MVYCSVYWKGCDLSMYPKEKKNIPRLNPFSRRVITLGVYLMDGCYILALLSCRCITLFPDFLSARAVYYGALETGPALLAAAVCAGICCDFIFCHYKR